MQWASVITFAGGVGLFLLGMRLMSDGLKFAAGPALRGLLLVATRSRMRAVLAGASVTALVQSSSAVIFATIGFVNAGLLTLGQSVGVIFGANVGTTLTSWIVATVGFSIDLQALGLPAVALGMALWLGARGRRAALGQALVGFGVFFLGLDVLKSAFAGLDQSLALVGTQDHPWRDILIFTGIGVLLTAVMQSSSAALAVTLTAASQGLLPLTAAAAMVVGANVGTTSTALLASIGATAAARRSAVAHVVFNLFAAALALPLLPWLLVLSSAILAPLGGDEHPATVLAVIHTLVNLLGVLAIWPLMPALVNWLERRFRGAERKDEAQPRHLDRNVLATPLLAVHAVFEELRRMGAIAQRMSRAALSQAAGSIADLEPDRERLERLGEAILDFVPAIDSGGVAALETALPNAVRVAQYYRGAAERAADLARDVPEIEGDSSVAELLAAPRLAADRLFAANDPGAAELAESASAEELYQAFEQAYQHAKGELLRLGSRGHLGAASLVRVLDRLSGLRRIVDQMHKAGRLIAESNLGGT